MSNSNTPVTVFNGNMFEADRIKIELENNGISAYLKDELIGGSIAPWHAAPGGAGAVKVMVAEKDMAEAIKIIQDIGQSDAEFP
jgi:hypothetical protein